MVLADELPSIGEAWTSMGMGPVPVGMVKIAVTVMEPAERSNWRKHPGSWQATVSARVACKPSCAAESKVSMSSESVRLSSTTAHAQAHEKSR